MKKVLCILASLALLCALAVGCATTGAAETDADTARKARGDEFRQQIADGTYPFLPQTDEGKMTETEEFTESDAETMAANAKKAEIVENLLVREFGEPEKWNPTADKQITLDAVNKLLKTDRFTDEEREALQFGKTYLETALNYRG